MGFPLQEYWSGLLFLLQRIFPTQEWNPVSCIGRWVLYYGATREAHTHAYKIFNNQLSEGKMSTGEDW